MTLRTRIKRALTFEESQDNCDPSRSNSNHGLSKITSFTLRSKKTSRIRDPNVYQPGEKMPPLKYRRPVNPEHKAHLESFNWAQAWRRRSDTSQYSPFGSRMPSRRASRTTVGRRSLAERRSMRGSTSAGVDSGVGTSIDDKEEANVTNGECEFVVFTRVHRSSSVCSSVLTFSSAVVSRPPSIDVRKSASISRRSLSAHGRSQSMSSRPPTADRTARRSSSRQQPFDPEELEHALKRSHLDTPTEQSDESGTPTPVAALEDTARENSHMSTATTASSISEPFFRPREQLQTTPPSSLFASKFKDPEWCRTHWVPIGAGGSTSE